MSKEQKGFIVYGDIQDVLKELDDEQVAQLFRGMVNYFVDGKAPKFTGVLKFVWIPIKQHMDRDAEKYEKWCEKNRQNIKEYWERTKENERIRTNTNATNTKTNTNTDTNTKKDTDTNTTTDTNTDFGRGRYKCDDEFNIWKRLTPEDIDVLYEKFPNSGGLLIDEVYEEVKAKKVKVKSGLKYILGYAKNVGWDDNADHFDGGGMA